MLPEFVGAKILGKQTQKQKAQAGLPRMRALALGVCLALQAAEACAALSGTVGWVYMSGTGVLTRGPVRTPLSHRGPPRAATLGLRAQIKFADAVEEVLVRKWEKKKVRRVVKSWRRMDEDYIHKEFKDEHDTWQVAFLQIAHSEGHKSLPVHRSALNSEGNEQSYI